MGHIRSKSYLLDDPSLCSAENARLQLQAEALFTIEKETFSSHFSIPPKKILDAGCGNGLYTLLLQKQFPDATVLGIDRNEVLLGNAPKTTDQCSFLSLDLSDAPAFAKILKDFSPDLVMMRFVLQHIGADAPALLANLQKHLQPRARLITLDTYDAEVEFRPPSDALTQLRDLKIARQQSMGGDRLIAAKLPQYLQAAGFHDVNSTKIEASLRRMGHETWNSVFWPVLLSGLTEAPDPSLVNKGEEWFRQAATIDSYEAIWPIYCVSGEKK